MAKTHWETQSHGKLPSEALLKEIERAVGDDLKAAFRIQEKQQRNDALDAAKEKVMSTFFEEGKEPLYSKVLVKMAFKKVQSEIMREMILQTHTRADGRKPDQIRHISVETGSLPRTHGSALFTRG